MANTYILIASNVLSSGTSTVTFSSIPSTYTDLVLRSSTRSQSVTAWASSFYYQFNGVSGSVTYATGYNTNNAIGSRSTQMFVASNGTDGGDSNGNTTSTFNSNELYLPNYLATTKKAAFNYAVAEQDGAAFKIAICSYMGTDANAITSVTCFEPNTFVVGSSFYLYGIKKN